MVDLAELERREMLREHFGREPTNEDMRAAFNHHDNSPPLKPLGRPCHDCAVEWGFYTVYSIMLAKQDEAFREYHSCRWYCHNNRNRACRGNINLIRALMQKEKGER